MLRFHQKRQELMIAPTVGPFAKHRGEEVPKNIMRCCQEIAQELDMLPETVHNIIRRLAPTTDVARMYLRSKALVLAHRVARNANVAESMQLLQNPIMGVIEPVQKGDMGGGGGFFLQINAQDCGAVKVGVQHVAAAPQTGVESPKTFNPFQLQTGEQYGSDTQVPRRPNQSQGSRADAPHASGDDEGGVPETTLSRAKRRLREAQESADTEGPERDGQHGQHRAKVGQKQRRLQGVDGGVASEVGALAVLLGEEV